MLTSPHDAGWYSDPGYDRSGHLIAFEPEPIKPTYCAICGDVAVEAKGQMCDFCASPEQIAERAEFDAWRENIRLVQLEEMADAPRTEAA